jgi:hypothetical protein
VHNVRALNRVKLRRGKTVGVVTAGELGRDDAGSVLNTDVRSGPVTAPFFDAKAADPVSRFVAEAQRNPDSGSARRLGTENAPAGRLPVRSGGQVRAMNRLTFGLRSC